MVCQATVKFNAQKGHEWMMVTFSKVIVYGNNIQYVQAKLWYINNSNRSSVDVGFCVH